MIDIGLLCEHWRTKKPLYEQLATNVVAELGSLLGARGVGCEISWRVKSLDSFLRKAVRKQYADPIGQTDDLAGVRVLLLYKTDLPRVLECIDAAFDVVERVDLNDRLRKNPIGYQGVHRVVRLRTSEAPGEGNPLLELRCEIQVQTRAQNVWCEAQHDLVYHDPSDAQIPDQIDRANNRLTVLMELFDDEMCRIRGEVLAIEGMKEAQVLVHLEHHFYPLARRSYDKGLSVAVVRALLPLLEGQTVDQIGADLDGFVSGRRAKLEYVFDEHRKDDRPEVLFLFQPEALLILALFERDRFRLQDVWEGLFPREFLEGLLNVWGESIM
ncbi:MAG: GTP pyrophosphokinase [Chloroflexota bacterium]